MADVYGRLTGRAGVCLSTLGPGRHQPHHRRGRRQHGPRAGGRDRRPGRDHAPAQGKPPDPRSGEPVPARSPSTRRRSASREIVPEIVRKAFKVAQTEKPGAAFIDFPENIAEMKVDRQADRGADAPTRRPRPTPRSSRRRSSSREAKYPVILAGNGVIRQGAADSLVSFAEVLRIPVANTFMAKGVMPFSNDLSLGHDRPEGARPAVVRVREGRRGDLRRLRHGRVPPRHVEPGRATRSSCTSTRCRPRWTSTTSSRSACWATSASRCARIAVRAKPQRAARRSRRVRKAI